MKSVDLLDPTMPPQERILRSIIEDIGSLLGVRDSPDGHEYVVAVRELLNGRKMPYYQMAETRAVMAESFIVAEGLWSKYAEMSYRNPIIAPTDKDH